MPAPETVYIADDVQPERFEAGSVIHPGCRLSGAETSVGAACEIGREAPVTIENCQLGNGVKLGGGYFAGSVFLSGSQSGAGAHVREGCLLEEKASIAHSVGLKQTVLMPFVTAGSLINFCDALMAGGRSAKDHSEIGSSYIHFNFTPNGDKATPSLVGSVPEGLLLNQNPIFLGGQGGLVGPARIAFGTIVAAGSVWRGDVLQDGQLVIPAVPAAGQQAYPLGAYRKIGRIIRNNLHYIGSIYALRQWYRQVRCELAEDVAEQRCCEGGVRVLNLILAERMKRLDQLRDKVAGSIQRYEERGESPVFLEEQRMFVETWGHLSPRLQAELDGAVGLAEPAAELTPLLEALKAGRAGGYIQAVQGLPRKQQEFIVQWAQKRLDAVLAYYRMIFQGE